MKLQKQKTHTVGGVTYHKFVVVLPNDLVERLGWTAGDELTARKSGSSVVLEQEEAKHK